MEGIFPSSFKIAQITPILKKPSLDPEDPSSYRPISNLRTISKLLERLVHSRLAQHLTTSPAFSTFQSAYRQMHSTETALIKVTNDLFNPTAADMPSILLAIDLSAAFDCVSHTKLMLSLADDFGVDCSALNWISSYLTDRTHFVKVGDQASAIVRSETGVPQGSVLGPLLFSAYVSPIDRLISSFDVKHVS